MCVNLECSDGSRTGHRAANGGRDGICKFTRSNERQSARAIWRGQTERDRPQSKYRRSIGVYAASNNYDPRRILETFWQIFRPFCAQAIVKRLACTGDLGNVFFLRNGMQASITTRELRRS